MTGPASSIIYVVRAENNLVKIGIGSDMAVRLSQLNSHSPIPLTLAYVRKCQGDVKRIEKHVHGILTECHSHGEWFRISVKEAANEIKKAAEELGFTLSILRTRKPIQLKIGYGPLQLRLPAEKIAWIDQWRERQPGKPTRSQAVRQLLDIARAVEEAKTKKVTKGKSKS